jgi:hypothetical protein
MVQIFSRKMKKLSKYVIDSLLEGKWKLCIQKNLKFLVTFRLCSNCFVTLKLY